LKFTIVGAIII